MTKTILITAGPTREYIDPVRYISNDSSGVMGIALAKASKKLGAKTTLILGPTTLHLQGVRLVKVISAGGMFKAVKKHYKSTDIIIMAAAVADFRPAKYSPSKLKKNILPSHHRTIALVPTPDILAWLGVHKRPQQTLVGFALETKNLFKNARKKLKNKNCDMIIANMAKAIGSKNISAVILHKNGWAKKIKKCSKTRAAKIILKNILMVDEAHLAA